MTTVETRIFDAQDGTLVESDDTDLEVALRNYFESPVRIHGKCPLVGGSFAVGILVEEATLDQVAEAFNDIGYDVKDIIEENGYNRVVWIEK